MKPSVSSSSADASAEALNFVKLWAKMQTNSVEWVVGNSTRKSDPAGTKRYSLAVKGSDGPMMITLGDPILPVDQNPVIVNQPGPSKRNPASKVYNALFRLSGDEAAAMRSCMNWMVESAFSNNVFGAFPSVEKLRENLSFPFTLADGTGKTDDGVWVSWQMEAPKGFEALRTKFLVSRADLMTDADGNVTHATKILRTYDGYRVLRDQPAACLVEFGDFKQLDPSGPFRGSAMGRVVLIDESVALSDDAPLPVIPTRAKAGYAFPYNGGYILWGTPEFPIPDFREGDVDLSNFKVFMAITDFRDKFRDGAAKYTDVAIDGVVRHFCNVDGVKGNPLIAEGSLSDPEDMQPYLMKTPAPHEDSLDSKSVGALTAINNESHAAAYTEVAELKLQQIFDQKIVGTGKKFDTLDKIRGEVALPGCEPEEPGQHYFLWQKFNLEAPKGIAELQTQFYHISPPGEPWVCERIDGSTLVAGRRFMSGYETSELKRATGKWREVLYTKVVFVTAPCERTSVPKAISWGGQTLDLGDVEDAPTPKRARVAEE